MLNSMNRKDWVSRLMSPQELENVLRSSELYFYVSLYSNHMTQKRRHRVIFGAETQRRASAARLPWRSSQLFSCLFSSSSLLSFRWSGSIQSFPAHRVQRGESGILASMRGIQEDQVAVQDGLKSQENLCRIHRYPVL